MQAFQVTFHPLPLQDSRKGIMPSLTLYIVIFYCSRLLSCVTTFMSVSGISNAGGQLATAKSTPFAVGPGPLAQNHLATAISTTVFAAKGGKRPQQPESDEWP